MFCQKYHCYIVKGRFGDTPESSGYTFINTNGCSTIDSFVVTKGIFDLITRFCINSQSASCHLSVSIELRCYTNSEIPVTDQDSVEYMYKIKSDKL